MPSKRLRAEARDPVRWRTGVRVSRRTSDSGTRRRLRSSRRVRSFPDSSHRRNVSALTPIALAASPSDMSFAICLSIA